MNDKDRELAEEVHDAVISTLSQWAQMGIDAGDQVEQRVGPSLRGLAMSIASIVNFVETTNGGTGEISAVLLVELIDTVRESLQEIGGVQPPEQSG